jgi:hypothetical protein
MAVELIYNISVFLQYFMSIYFGHSRCASPRYEWPETYQPQEDAMGTGLMIGMLMILGILVWALAAKMIDAAEDESRVRSKEQSPRR